jgi:hypothetical protein
VYWLGWLDNSSALKVNLFIGLSAFVFPFKLLLQWLRLDVVFLSDLGAVITVWLALFSVMQVGTLIRKIFT